MYKDSFQMFYYTITVNIPIYEAAVKHRLITILFQHGAENIIPATNNTFTFQSKETFATWKDILKEHASNIMYYFAQVTDSESDVTNYAITREILRNVEIIRGAIEVKKES